MSVDEIFEEGDLDGEIDKDTFKTGLAIGFGSLIAIYLFFILLNSLLIYGAAKERPDCHLPLLHTSQLSPHLRGCKG